MSYIQQTIYRKTLKKSPWASFLFRTLRWASFQDNIANSREREREGEGGGEGGEGGRGEGGGGGGGGGFLFEINASNIEIAFYKPIGLMKFFFDNFLYCKGTILKRRPWASFRDGLLFKITFTVWEFSYIPFMYVSLFIRNS